MIILNIVKLPNIESWWETMKWINDDLTTSSNYQMSKLDKKNEINKWWSYNIDRLPYTES